MINLTLTPHPRLQSTARSTTPLEVSKAADCELKRHTVIHFSVTPCTLGC